MKQTKRAVWIVGLIILLAAAGSVGFITGKRSVKISYGNTFYAVIEQIDGNRLQVKGLELNDINYRGRFFFTVEEATALEWRNTEITLEDLDAGATISITYTGEVQETSPAGLEDVVKIQLLDDELPLTETREPMEVIPLSRQEEYIALVESYIEDVEFRMADSDRIKQLSDRLLGHYDIIGRTDGGDREYYVAVRRDDAPIYDDFSSVHIGYLDDQLFIGYYDKQSNPIVLYDLSGYMQLDMPFGYETLDGFCFGISGGFDRAEDCAYLYAFDQRGRAILDFVKRKPGLTFYQEGQQYVQFYYQDEETTQFSSEPYACYIELTGSEQEKLRGLLLNSRIEAQVSNQKEALDYLNEKGNICSTGASLILDGRRYQSFGTHELPGYLLVTTEEQSDFLSLAYHEEIYRFLMEKVKTATGMDYGNFDSNWFKNPLKSATIVFPEYMGVNGESDLDVRTQTIETRDRLDALSALMDQALNSGECYGFSACPYVAPIDFIREDGETLRLFIATDSCDSMSYEGRIGFEYGNQADLAAIFDEAMALRRSEE